jgi:hypothetical protein
MTWKTRVACLLCIHSVRDSESARHSHRYSKTAYKGRNVIERMLCRLKDFRRRIN